MLYNQFQPAGYADEPVETVNYAGCHDGEIIFDQLIMKPADQVIRRSSLYGQSVACLASLAHLPTSSSDEAHRAPLVVLAGTHGRLGVPECTARGS